MDHNGVAATRSALWLADAAEESPGVTAMAIIALALGIGANTAIFTLVKCVLWYPLPYQQPERLVFAMGDDTLEGNDRNAVAPANFGDWRKQTRSLQSLPITASRACKCNRRPRARANHRRGVSANMFSFSESSRFSDAPFAD